MSNDEKAFVDGLVAILPALQHVYTKTAFDFRPDDPPITVLLGNFGYEIANIEGAQSFGVDQQGFDYIEAGVRSSNPKLADAITTGLIEALYSRAHAMGHWKMIRERLGIESLRLAESW